MISIPDRSIILAPGALHLSLYDTIYKQKGNCLNIQINTISTYIHSLTSPNEKSEIEILYAYKQALSTLDETNAFASSKDDPDFLKTCLDFIREITLYDVHDFPDTTRKEKSLKQIIDRLLPIDAGFLSAKDLEKLPVPFERIWILKTDLSVQEQYWADFLLARGAHRLCGENEKEKIRYWSCANARKEMEAAAQTILERQWRADEVFIAVAEQKDEEVLAQILDARRIPYTMLHKRARTAVPAMFTAVLSYLADKNMDTYCTLIRTLAPDQSGPVIDWLRQFEGVDLETIPYEDNALISEADYISWQEEAAHAKAWMAQHAFFDEWTISDMEPIAQYIQSLIAQPDQEDLDAFDWILHNYVSVQAQIVSEADLGLFIAYLKKHPFAPAPDSISGVLIGTRRELSALRPHSFFLGAHAKAFPALQTYTGIFDESYVRRTSLPSLKERLNRQRQSVFSTLEQIPDLMIIVPQSDYAGKTLETSAELEGWIGRYPDFVYVRDIDVRSVPKFALTPADAQSLFFSGERCTSSFAKVSTYSKCPLRYYLRFGLSLKGRNATDEVRVDGSLLSRVLQKAKMLHDKQYAELSYDDVLQLVQEEFAFAKKVFPMRAREFDSLIIEYAHRISELVKTLDVFETKLHLSLLNKKYELDRSFDWKGTSVEMKGSIATYDPMAVSFTVLDPELEKAGIYDDQGGLGMFDLSLKQTAQQQPAYKTSYRSAVPSAQFISQPQMEENVLTDRFVKGWVAQDLPARMNAPLLEMVQKKVDTYAQKEEKLQEEASSVLEKVSLGQIEPVHAAGACVYCPYKLICRNGAIRLEDAKKGE